MNIHFICRGNILRSIIAETYLKSFGLQDVNVISSGTIVNLADPQEREYFANTLALLERHGIASYAKSAPEQLTQARIDSHHDIVVFMNQRVVDEAAKIITMPESMHVWDIVDIGEGRRTHLESRLQYEDEIYKEITQKVDNLLRTT